MLSTWKCKVLPYFQLACEIEFYQKTQNSLISH